MKSFHLNAYKIVCITYIIFLFSQIKSQGTQQPKERELLKNCISEFNKTENRFIEISEKMKNIKYNIFLKIRYKNLKRTHNKIQTTISTIKKKLDSNKYDKIKVIEELKILTGNIGQYNRKCEKAIEIYYQAESMKAVIYNIIKAFFLTILIIIIVVMIIIGIVSFFIIRRQRKYSALTEEESTHTNIEINVDNQFNTEQIKIEEKLDEENEKGNSSSREIREKKDTKKKNENKQEKSKDEEKKE